jgi:serine phosphatase RsbU (regulator of sigma subunit)
MRIVYICFTMRVYKKSFAGICLVIFFVVFTQDAKSQDKIESIIEKQLALALEKRNSNVDSSIYYAATALNNSRKNNNKYFIAKSLGTLAESYRVKGGYSHKIITSLDEATVIFKSLKENQLLGRIYNQLGVAYDNKGDYKKSLSYYFMAIAIFDSLSFYDGYQETSNNIAVVYELLDDTASALKYYNQSLEYAKKAKMPVAVSGAYANMAGFYEKKGNFKTAIKYFNLALGIKKNINDWNGISRIYNNLGSMYYKEGNLEKGIKYFKQALELKIKINSNELTSSYYNLGFIEEDRGNFKQAASYYEKAYESANKFNDLHSSLSALGGLINVFDTLGEHKKAVKLCFQYIGLNDSLFSIEKNKQTLDLKEKYETDKKEKEIILQKERLSKARIIPEKNEEDSRRKTIFIIVVLSALALVIFLLGMVFKNYKQKQIANIQLSDKNKLIKYQKEIVEEKHKEITDSINYAERIQRSFLASKEILEENLKEYFVFFRPKDIVSGDFYWAGKLNNGNFALVTADSTGHGVPGAIMSILNISCLEKAIEDLTEPKDILNHTRVNIIERLKKDGSADGGKDGMDCSLISFERDSFLMKDSSSQAKQSWMRLSYSAANNPVWVIRENNILEFAPDKMPVGKHARDANSFTQHTIELYKNDTVYAITDGLPDQFGGPKGKKFMYKQLKEFLISISNLPMPEQKEKLNQEFKSWKGALEQVDDVTIIGIRV